MITSYPLRRLIGTLCLFVWMAPAFAQTTIDYVPDNWPDSRYTNNDNGTVTDKVTGLMWQRCSLGQSGDDCSSGAATTHTWNVALQLAADSIFADYNDWRLPNFKELLTLVADNRYGPSINTTTFPGTPTSSYWTSAPDANSSNDAWSVGFNRGDSDRNGRSNGYHVRLVRGGQ